MCKPQTWAQELGFRVKVIPVVWRFEEADFLPWDPQAPYRSEASFPSRLACRDCPVFPLPFHAVDYAQIT